MIFVDSNIPMYLVGSAHPHKRDAQRILERCIADRERLVTDAEVLQEILHRYGAIGRRDAIQPAFDVLLGIVDEVFPVDLDAVQRARTVLLGHARLSARDALHVAVMEQQGVSRIVTFDGGFDGYPGIARLRT
ncbi:MAG TPA: type II toxin-antitoxin system VapC family toxin [Vicinamibacteria bacterium]|nr:type II toxin-antitoxin system VapC family toxin [Vicinamibacteria bacterium]HRB13511.1 type II toxin-antitoxin system VapC family toxin [Vicinamibacteria bacterium]